MLGSALYFPTIDIHNPEWLRSAVLFWDDIRTIVPSVIDRPYRNRDTRILHEEGFLEPLRCDLHPDVLDRLGVSVLKLLDHYSYSNPHDKLIEREDPASLSLMHAQKVSDAVRWYIEDGGQRVPNVGATDTISAFRAFAEGEIQSGLAGTRRPFQNPLGKGQDRRDSLIHDGKLSHLLKDRIRSGRVGAEGDWLLVNSQFSNLYMTALASLLSQENRLSSVTDVDFAHGIALKRLLEDPEETSANEKEGALVSFAMKSIRMDPETPIEALMKFRRGRLDQFAALQAQFTDLSSKMRNCESARELQEEAKAIYTKRVKPELNKLKAELNGNGFQSVWTGVLRAVTVSLPANGLAAHFLGPPGLLQIAATAGITVTDVAVAWQLSRQRARRSSPFTYLLDMKQKFGRPSY